MIAREADDEEAVRLSHIAAIFATQNHPGRFCSKVIEARLCAIGKRCREKVSAQYTPFSFLHVMTKCFSYGGHTRLVEGWIDFSHERESHSVALVAQGTETIPERLTEAVRRRKGNIFNLGETSAVDKSLVLRGLGSQHQYVILHTHMEDPIPIVAFGTTEFQRPVLLYNHADHIFWLGASVCDFILDMSTSGQFLTQGRRGHRSALLPIPLDSASPPSPNDKAACRENILGTLQMPSSAKLVLSIGSPHKYKAVDSGRGFLHIARDILSRDENVYILVIGPSKQEQMWMDAFQTTAGRVNALGLVPRHQLNRYFLAADVYLDPYPCGGATAFLEALASGLPAVSVANGLTPFDSYHDLLLSPEAAAQRVIEYLNGGFSAEDALRRIERYHSRAAWSTNLEKVLNDVPAAHHVYDVADDFRAEDYDINLSKFRMKKFPFSLRNYREMAERIGPANKVRLLLRVLLIRMFSLAGWCFGKVRG